MSEDTDFLYPMIDGASTDADALLRDLAASARAKTEESRELTRASFHRWDAELAAVADAIATCVGTGGTVFTMGNGGSATDADGVAALFASPATGRAVPARSLVADVSIITALANDVGFDRVFSRQVSAHAAPGDVVVGFSTSGNSTNLLTAFETAHRAGIVTVGFAGDRGGAMAGSDAIDHLVVIEATSIHRIQEAQSALAYDVWHRVQGQLGAAAVTEGATT